MNPTTTFVREHLLLPDRDGDVVRNEQEPPQTTLLTGSIQPLLPEIFPDGQYLIGQDLGIYWRRLKPPLSGCKSPDWYIIPDVPPTLDGEYRRSYVMWEEGMKPLLLIEFVSGDGSEERDTTPNTGKFWVYERGISAAHYAISDSARGTLEVYKLHGDRFHLMEPNAAGRYPIDRLRIELGLWQGCYQRVTTHWLRFWDAATGVLLPSFEERIEIEAKRANAEAKRANAEAKRADRERKEREAAEALASEYQQNLKDECERAENERREKENERREKENERREKERLANLLRAAGIDPNAA